MALTCFIGSHFTETQAPAAYLNRANFTDVKVIDLFAVGLIISGACLVFLNDHHIVAYNLMGSGVALEILALSCFAIKKNRLPTAVFRKKERAFVQKCEQSKEALAKIYEVRKQAFMAEALNRFGKKPTREFVHPEVDMAHLNKAIRSGRSRLIGGCMHQAYIVPQIPGVIFKFSLSSNHTKRKDPEYCPSIYADYYVKNMDIARECCQTHDLFLLHIPHSKVISDETEVYIQEEFCHLMSGENEEIRNCYEWACQEPKLEKYMYELFRQLIVFITHFPFKDVKHANMGLSTDGRVCLYDLADPPSFSRDSSKIIGLLYGQSYGTAGLFNLIPHKWIDSLADEARRYLSEEDRTVFNNYLPGIKEQAKRRDDHRLALSQFNSRLKFNEPLILRSVDFADPTKLENRYAEKILQHINLGIEQIDPISVSSGRKVFLDTFVDKPFGSEFYPFNQDKALEALELLKKKGYIFSYCVRERPNGFEIWC